MVELHLHIKNMVCQRCIKAVNDGLTSLGAKIIHIELGHAVVLYDINDITKICEVLEKEGFQLIEDRDQVLLNEVKSGLIEYLHYLEKELDPMPLSTYMGKKVGKSYNLISKCFSKNNGDTLEQYFIKLKIERVKELLDYGELNLSQIAYLLKYSSVNYLSLQFKKVVGLTVTEYKKNGPCRICLDEV